MLLFTHFLFKALNDTELDGRSINVREDRDAVSGGGGYSGGNNRVYVQGLPWTSSWQSVKDLFREAGNVLHVDILSNADGR